MKTIEVTLTVPVPIEATDAQIREWIAFSVGHNGGIALTNPLCNTDLEARVVSLR